jgi:hypothetical protein
MIPPFAFDRYREELQGVHYHTPYKRCTDEACPRHVPQQRISDQKILISLTKGSIVAKWLTVMTSVPQHVKRDLIFLKSSDSCIECAITGVKNILNSETEKSVRRKEKLKGPHFGITWFIISSRISPRRELFPTLTTSNHDYTTITQINFKLFGF